jgi:hypothetical protein
VLPCGGGSDLFVTTHEGVAARHRRQRCPRHRFGLVLDLLDPLGSFSNGVAWQKTGPSPSTRTHGVRVHYSHAQGQVADLRGGFCPRVGLGLGPISVVLYSDANPRNHTFVRSRGFAIVGLAPFSWRTTLKMALCHSEPGYQRGRHRILRSWLWPRSLNPAPLSHRYRRPSSCGLHKAKHPTSWSRLV